MNLGNQNGGSLILKANKQWMSRPADQRFQTLDSLRDALSLRRNASRAVNMDLAEIRSKPTEDGQGIVINSGLTPARPSHWSFGQLARLVSAPAEYLRRMPVDLACRCLNESIDQTNEDRGEMKLMTIRDEEGGLDTLQAVTSTTYGRIWDADVASAVSRIVDRSGGADAQVTQLRRGGGADGGDGLGGRVCGWIGRQWDGGGQVWREGLQAGGRAVEQQGFDSV
jgi:hypothetical protein